VESEHELILGPFNEQSDWQMLGERVGRNVVDDGLDRCAGDGSDVLNPLAVSMKGPV